MVLVTSFALLALLYTVFPSPREQEYRKELSLMEDKYAQLTAQVEVMSKVLGNIQDRDANVHRMVFGMNPAIRTFGPPAWGAMKPTPNCPVLNMAQKRLQRPLKKWTRSAANW